MNKKTLTALRGSIRKWEKIVVGTGVDVGHKNCPLCKLFFGIGASCSNECPVKQVTGEDSCLGTPYDAWRNKNSGGPAKTAKQKNLARSELYFLKSLLPEPTRKVGRGNA